MGDGSVRVQVETELDRDIGIVGAGNVIDAIVAETANFDLTVTGPTREGLLQECVFGAIPVSVGERAHDTATTEKRQLGITSELRRWLRWQ